MLIFVIGCKDTLFLATLQEKSKKVSNKRNKRNKRNVTI